jgi:hypothetical protein
MHFRASFLALSLCLSFSALGCGGGKPAESPAAEGDKAEGGEPAEAGQADSEKSDQSKADAPKEDGATADAKAEKSADDGGPKPTRTPEDILTAPDTVFLFSYNDSEPKQAAEEKCSKTAGDNPKKMNQCMAVSRKKFPAEGHRFKQDDKGQWWWITVRQDGNRLTALHKVPIEFGEQTATTITLKPVGKDKGSAPMNVPAKVVFEVPNDYQIAIKDPTHGRLVFQAKVGTVAE